MAYLKDILIYSNSLYKYRGHIKIILKYLKTVYFFPNITKCEFYITKVPYHKFIINTFNIKID